MYVLHGSIDFGQKDGIGKKPVTIDDSFHSQFKLERTKYKDNNNFIMHNEVRCNDDIYAIEEE
jgi:hypothetical protein